MALLTQLPQQRLALVKSSGNAQARPTRQRESVCERERDRVCVRVFVAERESVCQRERESESEREWRHRRRRLHFLRLRESVCVRECVCIMKPASSYESHRPTDRRALLTSIFFFFSTTLKPRIE